MIVKVIVDRAQSAITRQRGKRVVLISADNWVSMEDARYLLRSLRISERLIERIKELEPGSGEEYQPTQL